MFSKSVTILALAASASAAPTCPETLDMEHKIDDAKTLYYAVVPSDPADANNGIFCARMEAAAEVWLGFGISTDGKMIGSNAVLANSPTDGPFKAHLIAKGAPAAFEVSGADAQTLMDKSFVQADGKSTMTFTKLLMEDGEIPITMGENTFLAAHGSSNEWGHHAARTSFKLDLGAPATMPEPVTTTAATMAATTAAAGATTAATETPAETTAATTAAAEPAATTASPADTSGSMSVRAVAVAASLIVPSLASLLLA